MFTEKIGMQSLEDRCAMEYDDAYNGVIAMNYITSKIEGVEPDLKSYGIPNNWIRFAEFVEEQLGKINSEVQNDDRIEIHFNEEKLKDFGYLFLKNFTVYLYRTKQYGPYVDSNYMFFNNFWGDNDESSTFMIDLYFTREDYFNHEIVGAILQEMVNVLRDIPLYFEEQANKEDNKEKDNEDK